jgi:hypothetical protein
MDYPIKSGNDEEFARFIRAIHLQKGMDYPITSRVMTKSLPGLSGQPIFRKGMDYPISY